MTMVLPPSRLRGLSVHQPSAYAIAYLGKDVEPRPWYGSHRGWTAIHVGSYWELDEVMLEIIAIKKVMEALSKPVPDLKLADLHKQLGNIIGVMFIDDWKPALSYNSPWCKAESYGLHISRAVWIDPIPCIGRNRTFEVEQSVDARIRRGFEKARERLALASRSV